MQDSLLYTILTLTTLGVVLFSTGGVTYEVKSQEDIPLVIATFAVAFGLVMTVVAIGFACVMLYLMVNGYHFAH